MYSLKVFSPPAQQGKLLGGNKASNAWGCLRPPLGGGGGPEGGIYSD